ncbi:MAG: hypothetical protein LQ352_000867 [Teloschistes flavicans]|nr:MAG: hypothetical protein LQ352_000867 [Teloschistes flavicans]
MVGQPKPQTLPILPLPKGIVLLPGVTLRIPVAGRSDVFSLLTSLYSRSKTPKLDAAAAPIGCVPFASPLLSPDGQQLIEGQDRHRTELDDDYGPPREVKKEHLFSYGTVAKISGVQGRRSDDVTLVVEGLRRFQISEITKEKPFLEAAVTHSEQDGMEVALQYLLC